MNCFAIGEKMHTPNEVREFLFEKVKSKVNEEQFSSISMTESLIAQGIFDSIDFITMLMEIENTFEIELDFDDVDPAQFTSIDGLIKALFNEEVVYG